MDALFTIRDDCKYMFVFPFCWWGIYLGLLVYTLISVGIQLYREYKMEKLLNVALDNWNKNDTIE